LNIHPTAGPEAKPSGSVNILLPGRIDHLLRGVPRGDAGDQHLRKNRRVLSQCLEKRLPFVQAGKDRTKYRAGGRIQFLLVKGGDSLHQIETSLQEGQQFLAKDQ